MLVFQGTIAHSTWNNPLEILTDVVIGVKHGKILFIVKTEKLDEAKSEFQFSADDIIKLDEGEFLIPGFVDTHIHASQHPNIGKALDLSLIDWLQKYTFPLESKYKDIEFASQAYESSVNRLVRNGTTTACYFATIHLDATLKLCDIIGAHKQRAFVGKVCVCCNSPAYYTETEEESVKLTESFVQQIISRKNPLITPIVTPRFTLTCTMQSMKQLAELAKRYELPIQSHLQETIFEEEVARSLFPGYRSSSHIFKDTGLLTERTIMAHGVHLADDDIEILQTTKTAIAHCPNSNISLKSGLCDVRRLLNNQIKVGLGTDVSGGYQASMLDAIRMAVAVSIAKGFQNPTAVDYQPINYKEAFRLATLGGSQALGISDKIGNFEVGKDFDALRINIMAPDSPIDASKTYDSIEDQIQKFLYLGDDRNIAEVYVAGKKIHSRALSKRQTA